MSLARMMSAVLAGLLRSMVWALPMTRKAPPVPLVLSWQPDAPHVLIAVVPLENWIGSCFRKTGKTQFWKYENLRRWLPCTVGFCKVLGFSNGLPPPQEVSPQTAAAAATMPRTVAAD